MEVEAFKATGRRMARAARAIVDFALPPQCPVSGARVSENGVLSAAAWAGLHFIDDPMCARCGAPFAVDYGAGAQCPACVASPPKFDNARACVLYDDASHAMVVRFKHSDRTELSIIFASWLARAGAGLIASTTRLAPVPLHPRRMLSRRFNQSALLARALSRKTGAIYDPASLFRRRSTPPQQSLNAAQRRRNMVGAFEVPQRRRAAIEGAHFVLIDDVLTTGATLNACASALKRAGAVRVDALAVARVVKGGVGAL